jgi:hypothetical protein
MSPKQVKNVVEQVVANYLSSGDFNGQLWTALQPKLPTDLPRMRQTLKELVKTGRITFRTTSLDPNPGIKRAADLPCSGSRHLSEPLLAADSKMLGITARDSSGWFYYQTNNISDHENDSTIHRWPSITADCPSGSAPQIIG